MEENTLTVKEITAGFGSVAGFELLQRQGAMLSKSSLLPTMFKNNVADCSLAIDMSNRMRGVNPLTVLQEIYFVHNKPGFSSKFLISLIRCCGRFRKFDFEMSGDMGDMGEVKFTPVKDRNGELRKDKNGDQIFDRAIISEGRTCIAYAIDHEGNRIDGVPVSMGMAKLEGWYDKPGSKWQTMSELMLRYRAATFFKNLYCPEITMGIYVADEIEDIDFEVVESRPLPPNVTRVVPIEPQKEKPLSEAEEPDHDEGGDHSFNDLEALMDKEGLTHKQLMSYAAKNGMVGKNGNLDANAARKIFNAWNTVKSYIAREAK